MRNQDHLNLDKNNIVRITPEATARFELEGLTQMAMRIALKGFDHRFHMIALCAMRSALFILPLPVVITPGMQRIQHLNGKQQGQ